MCTSSAKRWRIADQRGGADTSAVPETDALPRPGLLITNPPYGERIGAEDLAGLYQSLGALLRTQFEGWRAAVLTGNPELGKRMGLRAQRFHTLYNGPIECRLLHFEVSPAAHVSDRPRPLPPAERGPGAEMLANRLRKNSKGAEEMAAQREGIGCYRLYDADLPEYALAVDLYQSAEPATPERRFVHVQEYAAPSGIDPKAARLRLREAIGVIAEVLDVPEPTYSSKSASPARQAPSTSGSPNWPLPQGRRGWADPVGELRGLSGHRPLPRPPRDTPADRPTSGRRSAHAQPLRLHRQSPVATPRVAARARPPRSICRRPMSTGRGATWR